MASSLDPTYGIAFVAFFLATLLYGMGLIQAYLYFHWYPEDRWGIKTMVVCVMISETMQITLYFAALYLHLIDGFGNFAGLGIIFWEDAAQVPCGYLSALLVQMYFGYCIYICTLKLRRLLSSIYFFSVNPKRKLVSLVIVLLGLISLVTAIATTIRTVQISHHSLKSVLTSEANVTKAIMTAQSAATLACDLVITVALTHVLKGRQGGIEVQSTRSIITTLIINAVSRGVLTTLCAAFNMILFLAQPNTYYFYLGLVLSGKLYMNSMLATLNTRQHLRRRGENSQGVYSLDAMPGESAQNRSLRPNHVFPSPVIVLKQTTTTTDSKTFNVVSDEA
ncbi:hypothetical protein DFH08DRAFT_120286 [Mycena albidolilacea]|uniref:DUF6534 domain-containing protein n=1 Tax=Mycena albidolilacea TaxID=1033008 RepID=A0AAD6YY77_9AGAR|nr:hypothetical protein DFH08DRAFT_120286 [Mycena albidolilacea]